jgi:hypothetical protein
LDFDPATIGNKMKFAENEARWRLLLKGLGSICPGKRFNPMQVAEKIIGDIETKDQTSESRDNRHELIRRHSSVLQEELWTVKMILTHLIKIVFPSQF